MVPNALDVIDVWCPGEIHRIAFPTAPRTTRIQGLPFGDLLWENFEQLPKQPRFALVNLTSAFILAVL
jgi:hypothetical protein